RRSAVGPRPPRRALALSSGARRPRAAGRRWTSLACRLRPDLDARRAGWPHDRRRRRRLFAVVRREGAVPRHRSRGGRSPRRRSGMGVRHRPMTFLRAIAAASERMIRIIYRYRRMLAAITRVELAKRHAGSLLGFTWVILQPALLLSVYLFVYMVVLRMRFEGFSRFEYVLYVFCGLVPYLGFMEALTAGGLSIKQNIHLVKNVMLPIELIPVRSVIVGMASEFVSLGIVLVLSALSGSLTYRVVFLPIAVLLEVLLLVGLTWILSSITVALPDITYFV